MKNFVIGLLIMVLIGVIGHLVGLSDFLTGAFAGEAVVYWLFRKDIFFEDGNFKET